MTYSLEFEIAERPRLQTNNYANKWARHKATQHWAALVEAAVREAGRPVEPLPKAGVVLIRHSASEPDYDNLVASFKPLVDGLTKSGVISDDKPSVVGHPEYRWRKAKPKQGRVTVRVGSVDE